MKLRCVFVLTHDSIGVGGDGPTHQPIEHVASLRVIPICRCGGLAIPRRPPWPGKRRWSAPTARPALIFTRQKLPHQDRAGTGAGHCPGGYVLLDCGDEPEAILIATGSEVQLAVEAAQQLNNQGRRVRVVSMPSVDVFDAQDAAWRESVLPAAVTRRVVVEAGVTAPWYKYAGPQGMVIGIDRFGECGPPKSFSSISALPPNGGCRRAGTVLANAVFNESGLRHRVEWATPFARFLMKTTLIGGKHGH